MLGTQTARCGLPSIKTFFKDRIQVNTLLVVLCFVSVLTLSSQSASSYSTYLLALAMLLSVRRWNDVFRLRLMWGICALLGYLVVTSFWSEPFAGRGLVSVLSRALLVLLFVVAFAECQLRGTLRTWLGRALALAGSLATAAAIVVFVIEDPVGGRLNGLGQLDTHIIAALVFGVVLIFVVERLLQEDVWGWRACAVIAVACIASAVFLSDSRNAWVSVATGVSVFLLTQWIGDRRRFVGGVLAVALLGGVILAGLAASDATRDALLPRGDSHRPAIWANAFAATVQDSAWFGRGILTDNDVPVEGERTFKHPHSLYLSVFYQGGIVGVALLAVVIIGVLRVLLQRYEHPDAKLALGVLGLALPAYLLDGHELIDKVGSTWFMFWLPVGIALGLCWGRPRQEV
jgi:O-antigen ligase